MIKTVQNIMSQDKEKFVIPKSVQQTIPIQTIWNDGIFKIGKNKFSKTFKFTDINYCVLSEEDRKSMFKKYVAIVGSLDTTTTTKITVNNRHLNQDDFEKQILIPLKEDGLDIYRKEYNAMLLDKAMGTNRIVQEKYVTVSVYKRNIEEARNTFKRIGTELRGHFTRLGSKMTELDATERLRCLHDFYRVGEETQFEFDIKDSMKKGHHFKDIICPDTLEFRSDYFKMGERYGRVLFLRRYGNYIDDDVIAKLMELNRNMMFSADIITVPTDEAIREVEKRLLGVETNITNWQRKQNENQNYSAIIPYDMQQQREEAREVMEDLTERDMKLTFAVITLVHTAQTKEQLDQDTEALLAIGRVKKSHFSTLKFQQMDGLNTVLPIGQRKIDFVRTLISESLGTFIPFNVQEIMDDGGIFFGQNASSGNLIMCNKEKLLNPNAFILGVPGSGKSFNAKENIVFLALSTDDDILICDPEREYAALIEALGGEVIRIAPGSEDHINAMDMVEGYGDGKNPIIEKSQFVLSIFEQLEKNGITSSGKSIIDRCTREIYEDYQNSGKVPTLCVLREKLYEQPEPEAHKLALSMELFTDGSLNAFAHETNVDMLE